MPWLTNPHAHHRPVSDCVRCPFDLIKGDSTQSWLVLK